MLTGGVVSQHFEGPAKLRITPPRMWNRSVQLYVSPENGSTPENIILIALIANRLRSGI